MGNSTSRVVGCFGPLGNGKNGVNLDFMEPLDEGLGHSFCYVRPVFVDSPAITPSNSERYTADSSTFDSETHSGSFRQEIVEELAGLQRYNKSFAETTFKTISGASVSANISSARTPTVYLYGDVVEPAASFESTASFAAIPLQPVPRGSGPLDGFMSGPLERGFSSGPLERGFASGPLERGAGLMSGPLDKGTFMSGPLDAGDRSNFPAPLGYGRKRGIGPLMKRMSMPMRSALSRTFSRRTHGPGWMQRFLLNPMTQMVSHSKEANLQTEDQRFCAEIEPSGPEYSNSRNLQWAHGKAGEDRVHVVLSEEQGWLFIGIYDGFSGPDAPDFLMSNLYNAIDKELEGLLWDYEDKPEKTPATSGPMESGPICDALAIVTEERAASQTADDCCRTERDKGIARVQSSEDESGKKLSSDTALCNESIEANEMVKERNSMMDIDQVQMVGESSQVDQVAQGDNLGKDAPKMITTNSINRTRMSKRLYELLQLELDEDTHAREAQLSRAGSVNGDVSGVPQGTDSPRDSEGVSVEDSKDLKPNRTDSVSLGNKQMAKSLIGSKLRKMYKKQKTMRKKLFPWNYDWNRGQHQEDEGTYKPSVVRRRKSGPVDHDAVLRAMTQALAKTEEAYTEMVEKALDRMPELALMGSCVLVMLIKDQDVYVMNLGDSRVILAQDRLNDHHISRNHSKDDARRLNRSRESLVRVELDRISEESPMRNPNSQVCNINKNREISLCGLKMKAVQLSTDHSTSIEEEVSRIKAEHVDDVQAVFNGRVKGQLLVTRAFGACFLKKPNFNAALFERFRVDYRGDSPYLSCIPSVLHHRLNLNDHFLVLSSDGLYQYFSNEEVVSHVAWFMENVPEGDPAQYLIAELLFRAAKKNGMDFRELLEIRHGDRRKYHDDVSVMVISLEGRIWRSAG